MTPAPLAIHVKRFWTRWEKIPPVKNDKGEIVPLPDGAPTMREVDWCEYGQVGFIDRTAIIEKVARLAKVIPRDEAPDNAAVQMANLRWDCIRPLYENWKAGRSAVTDGTPLAAWNRLASEQVDLLQMRGVQTVEHVAGLTDAHITRLGVPGMRDVIEDAKRFLSARHVADQASHVEDQLRARDERIESQSDEIAELRGQIAELLDLARAEAEKAAASVGPKAGRAKAPEPA